MNERIRVPEVRLVGPGGEQVGVVAVDVALRLAREKGLDLVEVAPGSRPPVAKIMDFGKFKYEQAQKAKEARRNQANTALKEVRFRLKIDDHDYETKVKRAEGFLRGGDKVKAMILFRGREQSRPEMGVKLLQRFAEDVAELGQVESRPTLDGRNMTMIVTPLRSKSDARAEQNEARRAQREAQQEKRREAAEAQTAHQQKAGSAKVEPKAGDATFDANPSRTSAAAAAKIAAAKPAAKPAATDSEATPTAAPARSTAAKPTAAKSTTKASVQAPTESAAPKPAAKPAAKAKPAPKTPAKPAKAAQAEAPAKKAPAKPATPKTAAKPAAPKTAAKPAAPKTTTKKPAAPKPKSTAAKTEEQ